MVLLCLSVNQSVCHASLSHCNKPYNISSYSRAPNDAPNRSHNHIYDPRTNEDDPISKDIQYPYPISKDEEHRVCQGEHEGTTERTI